MSTQLCLELNAATMMASTKKPFRLSAADEIRRILMDVLPDGVPPSFGRVVQARFKGKARIAAELEMVDGLIAQVEAWRWCSESWAHRWIRLDGGDLSWDGGEWRRVQNELESRND